MVKKFYDEINDLVKSNGHFDLNDNKTTNIDSITINRNPNSDNEVSIKKYFDDELDKNTIVSFNQTLQNYLKVTVGNDTYKLTKNDTIKNTDMTEIKFPNIGSDLLQKRHIKRNNKHNDSKVGKFYKINQNKQPNRPIRSNNFTPNR